MTLQEANEVMNSLPPWLFHDSMTVYSLAMGVSPKGIELQNPALRAAALVNRYLSDGYHKADLCKFVVAMFEDAALMAKGE